MNDRLTAAELATYRAGFGLPQRFSAEQARALRLALPATVVAPSKAKDGPRPLIEGKYRNKTEAAYALHLEGLRISGQIVDYGYERIALRLAKRTTYNPDFDLVLADRTTIIDEVKGFWRDDARVKIKVAARMFPHFRFRAVTREKGDWVYEEISR